MKIVAVIHARGGSVRIPNKNRRILCGKPLVVWMIQAALASRCERVIVSTDCDQIKKIALKAGADVPFKRPAKISTDVPSEIVTEHAIVFHEKEIGSKIDLAVTLQPTTPFVKTTDIDGAIKMMEKSKRYDSVFSAGPVIQRPEWMYWINKNRSSKKVLALKIQGKYGVSQSLQKLWHPNGGIYVTPRNLLIKSHRIIGKKPGIFKMNLESSLDIDEELDLKIAEVIGPKILGAA